MGYANLVIRFFFLFGQESYIILLFMIQSVRYVECVQAFLATITYDKQVINQIRKNLPFLIYDLFTLFRMTINFIKFTVQRIKVAWVSQRLVNITGRCVEINYKNLTFMGIAEVLVTFIPNPTLFFLQYCLYIQMK